jgi:hypothetical protein
MRSIEPIEPLFAGLETMQAHGIPRVMTERLRARSFDRSESWHWVLAPSRDIANSFYLAVAEWNRHVHGEILVFEAGCFSKSKELQDDIASFSVDDLVLAGDLGSALRLDLKRFLESKATYARAKVPWKRGLLFLGPPGNGKTHAVKGLLRESGLPAST